MNSVDRYYSQRATYSNNLLFQVGKTVNGEPISKQQLNLIVDAIENGLNLNYKDSLVDFGCGNGLLTNFIAPKVKVIVGIEINQALYEQATRHVSHQNISLIHRDILCNSEYKFTFNKAFSYEVIQHLSYTEVEKIISNTIKLLPKDGLLYLGGIPDEQRKWNFYNTETRKSKLAETLLETGTDPVGTWFTQAFFSKIAERFSVSCELLKQHPDLYTAHYRFDCLFRA